MSYANNHFYNSSDLFSELLNFKKKIIKQSDTSFLERVRIRIKAIVVLIFGRATLDKGIELNSFLFKDENSRTFVIRFKKKHLIKFGITKDEFMFVEDYKYNLHVRESFKGLSFKQRQKLTQKIYDEYFMLLREIYNEYVVNDKNDQLTMGAIKFRERLMGDIEYVGIVNKKD